MRKFRRLGSAVILHVVRSTIGFASNSQAFCLYTGIKIIYSKRVNVSSVTKVDIRTIRWCCSSFLLAELHCIHFQFVFLWPFFKVNVHWSIKLWKWNLVGLCWYKFILLNRWLGWHLLCLVFSWCQSFYRWQLPWWSIRWRWWLPVSPAATW